jgi:hypothetical protein
MRLNYFSVATISDELGTSRQQHLNFAQQLVVLSIARIYRVPRHAEKMKMLKRSYSAASTAVSSLICAAPPQRPR